LVPAQSVLFAFLIVLLVGSILVTERTHGTLTRLRLSPLGPAGLVWGKFLPVVLVSLVQNALLFATGWAVFGMRFGPESWSPGARLAVLIPLLLSVSVAASGLALLVAAIARGEMQVALLGALPALVAAVLGGCILPRELFPESTRWLALFTPHGWALNAYLELLDPDPANIPNLRQVAISCLVLWSVGLAGLAGSWALLNREWRR
jgi:ABC-type multidrug transport system permease subunit